MKWLFILILSTLLCEAQGRRLMIGNSPHGVAPIQVFEFVTAFDTPSGIFNPASLIGLDNYDFCGYWFVPTNNVSLVQMGRYIFPGNTENHSLVIISNCTVLATGVVQCANFSSNTFGYWTNPSPITLLSNTLYWIGSKEGRDGFGVTDSFYRKMSSFSNNFNAVIYGDITNALAPGSCPATVTNALLGVPVNFKFTIP